MELSDLAQGKDRLARGLAALSARAVAEASSARGVALGCLAALFVAEALTVLVSPLAGLALHGLILMALLAHSARASSKAQEGFFLALALAPLIRLLSLTVPLHPFPLIYWYLILGVPLFLAASLAARFTGIRVTRARLTPVHVIGQIAIGLTGIGLGYLEYQILQPDPLVAELRWELVWLPALILLVFTGLLEEVIFRGLMQPAAIGHLGRSGLLYVAVLFTVLHLGYRSLLDLLFVLGVALFFGWVAERTRSIVGVTFAHGLTNIGLFLVFPFLLAGGQRIMPEQPLTEPPSRPSPPLTAPRSILSPVNPNRETAPTHAPEDTGSGIGPVLPTDTPGLPAGTLNPGPAALPFGEGTGETALPSQAGPSTATPTATKTTAGCRPPPGWVIYWVHPGDSLGKLSQASGTSIQKLRAANCLTIYSPIKPGDILYLPSRPASPDNARESEAPAPAAASPTHRAATTTATPRPPVVPATPTPSPVWKTPTSPPPEALPTSPPTEVLPTLEPPPLP